MVQSTPNSPVHWARLDLDKHSSLWVKNIDLDNKRLTYKILSPTGTVLEYHEVSTWSYDGNLVYLSSCGIPMQDFQRILKALNVTSETSLAYEMA